MKFNDMQTSEKQHEELFSSLDFVNVAKQNLGMMQEDDINRMLS